ncbi:ATP-dependent DNA helicase DinG [Effusibacillus lacus]|uniref:3'-5' exonuclease DinG n=1 Tax=Effusibacillus lacus TaxID=1348429 RepID=A0A292YIM2_9BACL|nr:ATP-dependent DNA helicase DinG [Effusibacillus lacus]TCS75334.1 ATP-dependent DNA helicase DinG [Effusibacillus lacus]GAX89768.1 ATP-dependent DNA helicase DinG [Effusibacillus lacus]
MSVPYVVFDLETTGFNAGYDTIVEIGAVRIENGKIIDTFETFVAQDKPLPAFFVELTGITDEDVTKAPDLDIAVARFLQFADGADWVAHNALFDISFMNAALEQSGYLPYSGNYLDTLELSQILLPREPSYSLEALALNRGIAHGRPHRALSDALATAELLLQLIDKARNMPLLVLQQIEQLASMSDWSLRHFFRDLAQEPIQLMQTEIPDGCTVIHQLMHKPVQIPERNLEDREPIPFYPEMAAAILAQEGPLAAKFAGYEERPSQLQMVRAVAEALTEGRHLIVEAGTGTGKSLAYLVPAILHASATGEKVVVATHTINLQEQIKLRDLPLLHEIMGVLFEAAVVKGRNNYVCMRKVANGVNSQGMLGDNSERSFYARMLTWLLETEAGDREEINLPANQTEYWMRIASDSESCIAKKCPWFRNCYYFKNRTAADQSDVIITNHSLVFSDIKADHRVLPPYNHLIIDEAHHIEDEATKHLGEDAGYFQVNGALSRLARDNRQGLLTQLRTVIGLHARFAAMAGILDQMTEKVLEIRGHSEETFRLLHRFALDHSPQKGEGGRSILRIAKEHQELPVWNAVLSAFDNLQTETGILRSLMNKLETEASEFPDEEQVTGLVTDIGGQVQELDRRFMTMARFFRESDTRSNVLWIEADDKGVRPAVSLNLAPVNVGPLLKNSLFEKKDSVVLTSATITINQGFSYIIDRLGLRMAEEEGRLQTLQVDSPFDYKTQALLCIPTDVTPVKGVSEQEFVDSLCESLTTLARISNGRMLVLFTSHKMLRDAYTKIKPKLAEHNINIFAHGIDSSSRVRLVHEFKRDERAVLFGANSFWEGVDIPGDDLSCVVIVRLPFWPPNHPVAEARAEALEREGRNSFMDYSVPQAIVRFKQGFGRLIRSKKDVGAIVVYDRRLVDARYGKHFIRSLPGPWIYQGPEKEVLKVVYNWLKR